MQIMQLTKPLMGLALVTTLLSLSACNTMQERTQLEGCGIGAVLGGLIGALSDGTRGAAIGATAGCAVGAVAGKVVADRKQQYADEEALLEGEAQRTAENVETLRNINADLRQEIQIYDQEIATLKAQIRQGNQDRTAARATYNQLVAKRKTVQQAIAEMNTEIEVQTELHAELAEKETVNAEKLAEYKADVDALTREKDELSMLSDELVAAEADLAEVL